MSDTNNRGSGSNDTVRGDTKAMPDRGTSTGMSGNTDMGGMSINPDATNSAGSMTGACKSDPMADCMNKKATQ